MNTYRPSVFPDCERRLVEYATLSMLVIFIGIAALHSFGLDLTDLFYNGIAHVIADVLDLFG